MTRASVLRMLLLFAGLTTAMASPVVALAHGHAHAHAAEHRDAEAHHGETTESVDASDHHGDHAHPRLDPGTSARGVKTVAPLPSVRVAVPVAAIVALPATDPPPANESPPSWRPSSTAPPRAPPAF